MLKLYILKNKTILFKYTTVNSWFNSPFSCSQEKMPPLLSIQRDRRRCLHEAAGAWWDALLLQRPLQHMCAGRVCGELPAMYCNSTSTVFHLHILRIFKPFHMWDITLWCKCMNSSLAKLSLGETALNKIKLYSLAESRRKCSCPSSQPNPFPKSLWYLQAGNTTWEQCLCLVFLTSSHLLLRYT